MRVKLYIYYLFVFALFINTCAMGTTLPGRKDTLQDVDYQKKYDRFYDSMRVKAEQNGIIRLLHNSIIHKPHPFVDKKAMSMEYYYRFKGKTISQIKIKALEIFGPDLNDTTKQAKSRLEKFANRIHTKTNLNIIKKNLLFREGEQLDPEILYENERILRQLPFIQDVRILLNTDTLYPGLVKVTVLTKDVFSFGVTGNAEGEKANFEVYNRNIFGAGHEISVKMVGHLHKEPYLGLETYYSINNINGKFINVSAKFSNTYMKEEAGFNIEKEFLTPLTKWGGGIKGNRLIRTNQIIDSDPVKLDETPLNLLLLNAWAGRSFQINPGKFSNSQITLAGRIVHQYFYKRPEPDISNNQYFSNRTFYLAGITWSQRRYIRDQLIYSYGITEDIPEGFKNEVVAGYDANEFGNRFYTHIYLSNGNLLPGHPGYLFLSAAAGGYFNKLTFEQGLARMDVNYISRLFKLKNKRCRFFGKLDYMLGIRRFDVENLLLRHGGHIRGFSSSLPKGKQRLSLNLETVFFQQREIYKFYIALFLFADVGIIGSNKEFIFNEHYYSGLGIGIRLHNESLVLKTIQLRLAFYPYHPKNMNFAAFILEERTKHNFYEFQPTEPEPLRFQ